MKKKKTFLVVIIVAVFVLLAGLLVWFLWPKKSNKDIFTDAIKNSFGLSQVTTVDEDKVSEYKDYFKDKIVKLSISGYSNMAGDKSTDKIDLYYGKEEMYVSVKETDSPDDIGLEAVLKDSKLYFTVINVLSKYYYVDASSMGVETTTTKDNAAMEKLADLLDESLFGSIDNDKLVTEKTKIGINGVEYSVKKYSYDYTGQDLYNAVSKFVKGIKEDKELYNELKKAVAQIQERDFELDDILDLITSEAEGLKDYKDKLFTYTIFVDGDVAISTVISVNISQESMQIPISLTINNVENKGLVFKEVYLSTMGQRMFSAKFDEKSEGNADISVGVMGQEILTGYIKNSDEKFKFRIEGTDAFGSILGGSYFYSYYEDEEEETNTKFYIDLDLDKSKDGVNGKFKAELSMDGESVVLDYDIKTEEVKEIPEVDLSGALPYEEMTEEDKKALESFTGEYQTIDLNQGSLIEYSSFD